LLRPCLPQYHPWHGSGASTPAPPVRACLRATRARRRARRPQPDLPPRRRPARLVARLRDRELLPVPAGGGQGGDRAAAGESRLAGRARRRGGPGGAEIARRGGLETFSRPAHTRRSLAAALAGVLLRHLALLPRPDRRRTAFDRAIALALALAAHVGATGLRRACSPRRGRLGRGRRVARRLRAIRRSGGRPPPPSRSPPRGPARTPGPRRAPRS